MINLISTLPFYDNRIEQNQYKENTTGLGRYKHYFNKSRPITWQIKVPMSVNSIDSAILQGEGISYNVDATNDRFGLVNDGTSKWIYYNGAPLRTNGNLIDVRTGYYEWQVKAGGKTYYSEVFFVTNTDCPEWKIKIQAWNENSWNGFYFGNDFKFESYYDTFITNIIASIADDTLKDGYDRQNLSQRVITPTYQISFNPMPNILAVGLAVQMALKNIVITDRITGNVYNVKNTKFSQTPIEGTSFDLVELQFTLFDADYIANLCDK